MRRSTLPLIVLLGLTLRPQPSASAPSVEGAWSGTGVCDGAETPLVLELRRGQGRDDLEGRLDLPALGSLGRPLTASELKRSRLSLTFGEGRGAFKVDARARKDRMEGEWSWRGRGEPCRLELAPAREDAPYREEDVIFFNGEVRLAGSVFIPPGPGPHGGIVLMHGSGDNLRWVRRAHADRFARAGLVSLFFDKRGCGESTGDWRTVGFEAIARDGLAGIELLRRRRDVDPERVGFWGISQAGWIMPLAASLSEGVAFIVTTSGAAVTVEEEGYYDYLVRLRDRGHGEETIAKARALLELDFRVSMTGEGMDELLARVEELRSEPWFSDLGFLAAPPEFPTRRFYRLIGDYDPVPVLEKVDVPNLWIYGQEDRSVDPERSIEILDELREEQGKDYTICLFPGADHGLRIDPGPDYPLPIRPHAPGYFEAMVSWLEGRGFTAR